MGRASSSVDPGRTGGLPGREGGAFTSCLELTFIERFLAGHFSKSFVYLKLSSSLQDPVIGSDIIASYHCAPGRVGQAVIQPKRGRDGSEPGGAAVATTAACASTHGPCSSPTVPARHPQVSVPV